LDSDFNSGRVTTGRNYFEKPISAEWLVDKVDHRSRAGDAYKTSGVKDWRQPPKTIFSINMASPEFVNVGSQTGASKLTDI
jgi:hypothetical protein